MPNFYARALTKREKALLADYSGDVNQDNIELLQAVILRRMSGPKDERPSLRDLAILIDTITRASRNKRLLKNPPQGESEQALQLALEGLDDDT
jgi:hypothetical protein